MKMDTSSLNSKKIIDRTLPEVFNANPKISRLDILNLCWMLFTLGADLIEIDLHILKKLGKLPAGLNFLYRVDSGAALEGLRTLPVKNVALSRDVPHFDSILDELAAQCKDITVEFRAESICDIYKINRLRADGWVRNIKSIRIVGMNRFVSAAWMKSVEYIKKVQGVNIDICPENLYYNATALAVEGMMETADHITASFMGYGGTSGYAAIEQVLTFASAVLKSSRRAWLNILPELAQSFSMATGVKIPENMPVIGKNIFRYESGIHADGINKNPVTYEPYDPTIVGQERKLSIGKHSGSKSVANKLQELGVETGRVNVSDFLKLIREKSILLRRNLEDNEILELLRNG